MKFTKPKRTDRFLLFVFFFKVALICLWSPELFKRMVKELDE
jgi:hypothetical protein